MPISLQPAVGPITHKNQNQLNSNPMAKNPSLWPHKGGGNFVEMSLKVLVKQSPGTLFAFDPTFPHGITWPCNAHNHTITIAYLERLLTAFEKAKQGHLIKSGKSLGDGNCPEIKAD